MVGALTFQIRRYERLGSTSDELRRLAEEGAPSGTVVHAAEQLAGRGRQGRIWVSPPGNLYMSVLLQTGLGLRRSAELGFVAGLAVADAVVEVLPAGRRTALKWPNDVLIDGAKAAGVLVESWQAEGMPGVILGIGLNVGHAPEGLPYEVTCLRARGATVTVETMLQGVLAALARRWESWLRDGFDAIRQSWLACGPRPGTALRVALPEEDLAGSFEGLDRNGALLLRTPSGIRRVLAGDVSW